MLKNKMVTAPILVSPDWKKDFHGHVDVSSIALGIVLTQPRKGSMIIPSHFPVGSCLLQKEIIQPLRERDWPWFMH